MAEPVRIGIIGVGQIGKHHLERYSKIPNAHIVAISDINEAEARRVAALYNIPDVYTDFRELLKREDIEAVDVCLHNNLHMPMTVAALQAGKHVYCEKPMAGAYVDAEKMLTTAREVNKKLAIQFFSLFSEETKAAKSLIDAGQLGKLYHARSTGHRRRGRPYVDGYGTPLFVQKTHASGGALYDMGVYHIAQVLYLLGNPAPLTITGQTHQEIAMDDKRRKLSNYDVEELGLGFIRLAGGLSLDIIEAWAINLDKLEGSIVVGSDGGVRLDPFGYFRSVGDLDLNSTADLDAMMWRIHNVGDTGDAYDSSQHHWVAALQGRVELLPSAEIALNTMLISEGIYLSSQRGHEVTADEVKAASTSTAQPLPALG
ncbi:MAG: gfo/Idh/MocA family oxidoreductase [Anaerolineaceae bacterium]|nr:gfo/Idh/MocA family oxidoreductase [Anaerolineaceae bacterium]